MTSSADHLTNGHASLLKAFCEKPARNSPVWAFQMRRLPPLFCSSSVSFSHVCTYAPEGENAAAAAPLVGRAHIVLPVLASYKCTAPLCASIASASSPSAVYETSTLDFARANELPTAGSAYALSPGAGPARSVVPLWSRTANWCDISVLGPGAKET